MQPADASQIGPRASCTRHSMRWPRRRDVRAGSSNSIRVAVPIRIDCREGCLSRRSMVHCSCCSADRGAQRSRRKHTSQTCGSTVGSRKTSVQRCREPSDSRFRASDEPQSSAKRSDNTRDTRTCRERRLRTLRARRCAASGRGSGRPRPVRQTGAALRQSPSAGSR